MCKVKLLPVGMSLCNALCVDLRKQARQLENELDLKIVSFSKLCTSYTTSRDPRHGVTRQRIHTRLIIKTSPTNNFSCGTWCLNSYPCQLISTSLLFSFPPSIPDRLDSLPLLAGSQIGTGLLDTVTTELEQLLARVRLHSPIPLGLYHTCINTLPAVIQVLINVYIRPV